MSINQLELRLTAHNTDIDANSYLVVEILVDGKAIVNFGGLATDLHEFERSLNVTGDFYIVTCWCGDPGCAGINKAIHVEHEGEFVRWQLASPKPTRTFMFSQKNYQAELARVVSQGKQFIASLGGFSNRTLEITPNWNATFFRRVLPISSE